MSTKKKQARPDTSSARLAALLKKSGTMELAIQELHGSLKATKTYYDTPSASWVTAPDYASRVKAIEIALSYSVGCAIKRQEIVTCRVPDAPPDRAQLRETIDRRVAGLLDRPDLSLNELLAAKKSLVEAEQAEPPKKLTPEEREEEVRRILGIE